MKSRQTVQENTQKKTSSASTSLFFIATSQKSGTPFSAFDVFQYQGTHTCQEKDDP